MDKMAGVPVTAALDARFRAMADPVRRRILRVLEDSPEPRDVAGLAAALELHPNTVRGHLDLLESAGLVARSRQERVTPGRPRLLYQRAPEESVPSGYRLLAELLTTSLRAAAEDPAAAAEETGWQWGHDLATDLEPTDDDVAALSRLLVDFGFAPRVRPGVIELSDCPFRDLARKDPEIVCRLHLGLMKGALAALGGEVTVQSLEPFVEPSLCRTVITSQP